MTGIENIKPVIVAIPVSDRAGGLHPARRIETLRTLNGETMGTYWSARFFALPWEADAKYLAAIEGELQTIVDQMSHWCADSDLSKWNRSPGGSWQPLRTEFFEVLDFSLKVAEETSGAFDPSVGCIVEEWGFGPEQKGPQPPSVEVLSEFRQRNGWRSIEIDPQTRQARHAGKPHLDLSAVAKGFAVDQIARLLDRLGIVSYLIEIGGELRARGLKQGLDPWWVAIEPVTEAAGVLPQIRIALSGWSIATSGDYRRYFEADGRRWTHTVDPRTGNALGCDISQVSVLHEDCMAADAYSTALMVLGAKDGIEFATRKGLAAVFVLRSADGLEIRCTEQFYKMTEQE